MAERACGPFGHKRENVPFSKTKHYNKRDFNNFLKLGIDFEFTICGNAKCPEKHVVLDPM